MCVGADIAGERVCLVIDGDLVLVCDLCDTHSTHDEVAHVWLLRDDARFAFLGGVAAFWRRWWPLFDIRLSRKYAKVGAKGSWDAFYI
jgi:hypothetical protein